MDQYILTFQLFLLQPNSVGINLVTPNLQPEWFQSSHSMSSRPTTNRLWTGQSRTYSRSGQSLPAAQSRPRTARPQTAVSVIHDGSYVIALLEGRGVSREVGIAALDKDTGKVMLVQVI